MESRGKKERHGEKEAMDRGGREKGISDGGKLDRHDSHYSGESEVIRMMCASIELLSGTPLSASRKINLQVRLQLIGLCCKPYIPPLAQTLSFNSSGQIMDHGT